MKQKQILVNVCLVLALTGLGWFCYLGGKTHDILLENLAYQADGAQQPGLEAIYAYLDNGKQIFMLDGDRTVASGSGKRHVLRIEILDENDKVIETKEISFTMADLGDKPAINVARAYRQGGI